MEILHNNCHFYGDIALCGTRGWFYEEDRGGTHDEKVFRRELGRLETSLKAAGKREKLCFLHYPPRYQGYECPEILELLERYGVRRCYYGHLHAESHRLALAATPVRSAPCSIPRWPRRSLRRWAQARGMRPSYRS